MAASSLDLLAAEVATTEAELHLAQVAAGIIPPGARRMATPGELDARTLFADLEAAHQARIARLLTTAGEVRGAALDALTTYAVQLAEQATSGADVATSLRAIASSQDPTALPGLVDATTTARTTIRDELEQAALDARADLLDEARDQGIPDVFLTNPPLSVEDHAALDTAADRLSRQPVEHVLTVAADHASTPAIAAGPPDAAAYGALDAAEQASTRSTEDVARQASTTGSGTGRRLGITGVTAQPERIYASELLDSNTCALCGPIDGKEYGSLESALADYPNAEGYIGCEGGGRCRGTLVIVWDREQPTGDTPPSSPPDMGPPTGPMPEPPPVPYGGPAALEPRPPRAPTPPTESPSPVPNPPPATGPTPTPPPPAPGPSAPAGEVDTELLALTDAELENTLDRVIADGDYDAAERYALEIDARADWRAANPLDEADYFGSTTRGYDWRADPRVTPAQLEDLEARAAAEAADLQAHYDSLAQAGIDLDTITVADTPATGPAGRRLDRLRVEYDDHTYQQYLAAEDVTRGTLIRADRYAEFVEKYGGDSLSLFTGPARRAYYYASRELRDYWEHHPRLSFDEYAVQAGVRSSKIRTRAEAAKQARETGRRLAEEAPEVRRVRRNTRPRRRARTPAEELEDQRRRAATERARIERAGGTVDDTS